MQDLPRPQAADPTGWYLVFSVMPLILYALYRYVILLYTQPDNFSPPANLSANAGVSVFDFPAYVEVSRLFLFPLTHANILSLLG